MLTCLWSYLLKTMKPIDEELRLTRLCNFAIWLDLVYSKGMSHVQKALYFEINWKIFRGAIFQNILSYYIQKQSSLGVLPKCCFTGKHLWQSSIAIAGVSPLIYYDRTLPRVFSRELTPLHTPTAAFVLPLIKLPLFTKSFLHYFPDILYHISLF